VQVGLGLLTCQLYPGGVQKEVDIYREAVSLAERAEKAGFDSIWCSEHHFLDDSYLPSVLPFCAAIAARTSRISIGTGVLLLPLYETLRLAEDSARTAQSSTCCRVDA
jgi:alkanesulfonate monooxygenase SsuD/methylene tetrahydromethanopterin reductase-like flavin-dependent oxidoreductase (luciferase family)